MSDDMGWIEGCYRLPYRNWEVVCIIKEEGISRPNYKLRNWRADVTGIVIRVPQNSRLNARSAEELLSKIFKIQYWLNIQGPDSLRLRCTADLLASKAGIVLAMAVIDDDSKDEIFRDVPVDYTRMKHWRKRRTIGREHRQSESYGEKNKRNHDARKKG